MAAALSSFPSRRLASDAATPDPCAARLPALANATLASLVRCGFPFNVAAGGGGVGAGAPMVMAGPSAGAAGAAGAGIGAWSTSGVGGVGGGGGEVVKPLADSLSPRDAYHLRQALVAAVSTRPLATGTAAASAAASAEEDGGGEGAVIEERRAAALELLLSAVKEQPALVVVLFWAHPQPASTPGATGLSPLSASGGAAAADPAKGKPGAGGGGGGGEEAGGPGPVVVGDKAFSGAVLAALKALSVELADGQMGLAGGEEALVMALELVLALWSAEGVGRLGQVSTTWYLMRFGRVAWYCVVFVVSHSSSLHGQKIHGGPWSQNSVA